MADRADKSPLPDRKDLMPCCVAPAMPFVDPPWFGLYGLMAMSESEKTSETDHHVRNATKRDKAVIAATTAAAPITRDVTGSGYGSSFGGRNTVLRTLSNWPIAWPRVIRMIATMARAIIISSTRSMATAHVPPMSSQCVWATNSRQPRVRRERSSSLGGSLLLRCEINSRNEPTYSEHWVAECERS